MLTYPQNFVSRFAPMADGTMAVAAAHTIPYVSLMHTPCRIPDASAIVGGSDRKAALDLRRMYRHFEAGLWAAGFLESPQIRRVSIRETQWNHENGALHWRRGMGSRNQSLVMVKDLASRTNVRLESIGHENLVAVEVERIRPWGALAQENVIDRRGGVSTSKFEMMVNYGAGLGGKLPFFSGWHFVSGGMACFEASSFLFDLMELALATQSGQGPVAFSLELEGHDEDQDLGVWNVPETDQTSLLSGHSQLERSLSEALPEVLNENRRLHFHLHRKGDPERGRGTDALPLSIDARLFRDSIVLTFFNTTTQGLIRLPEDLAPAVSAFFP